MTNIDDLIKQEINPFDLSTAWSGNFWKEQQDSSLTVESIHETEIHQIIKVLEQVAQDHQTRSILLLGDGGCGKSYLLGRLKKQLNSKAFFAYIGPWADSSCICKHILQYTVDSLMQVPEDQKDSQLLLWLKSLSVFTSRTLKERIFDDHVWNLLQTNRQKFIKHLKETYKKAGIYNADSFFGVLHDLTNPEL